MSVCMCVIGWMAGYVFTCVWMVVGGHAYMFTVEWMEEGWAWLALIPLLHRSRPLPLYFRVSTSRDSQLQAPSPFYMICRIC